MKTFILIFSLGLVVVMAEAEGVVEQWVQRNSGYSAGVSKIALDGSGNVIVTGISTNIGGGHDYCMIKYSNTGEPFWTNRFRTGLRAITGAAIAVDGSGNVFLAGTVTNKSAAFSYNYATVKYSSAGVSLWTNYCQGIVPYLGAHDVTVDKQSGNVYVTGAGATVAYSNSGVPWWTNRYSGTFGSISLDGSGNVFVMGYWENWDNQLMGYATIKYSGAGAPLWTNRYDATFSNHYAIAACVAIDTNGDAVITGGLMGAGTDFDYVTIKYSGTGLPLWTNRYNGTANGEDVAQEVGLDSVGNVFVTGSATQNGTGMDYTTIKYSSAGVPLWTNFYNGPANSHDFGVDLAVDGAGNVIVCGNVTNNSTMRDFTTIKYSNAGVPLWTNVYNGSVTGYDLSYGVAVDSSNSVFVTGVSWNGTNYDFTTIKYSDSSTTTTTNNQPGLQPIPLLIQKLNDQLVLAWANPAFALQAAPSSTGTFTNVPGATSPHTNLISGGQKFFRLISN